MLVGEELERARLKSDFARGRRVDAEGEDGESSGGGGGGGS